MKSFVRRMSRFGRDESGANALEYALVMILVAFAISVGAGQLGTALNTLFTNTASEVSGVQVPSLQPAS